MIALSRTAALSLLAICSAACVQVFQTTLLGKLPDHYDYWLQEFVHLAVLRRALLTGELPLWNPALAGGTPHLADPQAAVLYPLTAFPLLALDPSHVARLTIPLHFALAGVGAYSLARSLGTSGPAALTAGLGYMLAPHFAPIELPTYLQQSAAWTPWVLWALHRAFERRSFDAFALAGAIHALQLYRGYPQTWYFTGLLAGAFALFQVARKPHLGGGVVLTTVTTLALGAAQLLPTIELLRTSHRSASFTLADAAGRGRVTVLNLLGQAGPDAEVSGAYPGIVLLTLALLGGFAVRATSARFFIGSAAVGIALCFGSATPLWELAYRLLPGFGLWHMPHRALFIWTLSVAVLAAFGLDALQARWSHRRFGPFGGASPSIILSALVAVDLLGHTLPRLYGRYYPPTQVYEPPEAAQWLIERAIGMEPVRFISLTFGNPGNQRGDLKVQDNRRLAYLPPNVSALYPGLHAFQGYLAIRLERSGEIFDAINDIGAGSRLLSIYDPGSRVLDVFGVRYLVTNDVESYPTKRLGGESVQVPFQPRFTPVFHSDGVRIWENPNALPFAWWVPSYVVSPDDEALVRLDLGEIDVRNEVYVARTIGAVNRVGAPPTGAGSHVGVVQRSHNVVDLDVSAPHSGLVVVNQTLADGWRAWVDGSPTPVLSANGGQQAVVVQQGERTLTLRYLPGSIVLGAAITGAASSALAIWTFSVARRRWVQGAAPPAPICH